MPARDPCWNQTPAQLFEALRSAAAGLSRSEAAARLRRDGVNRIEDDPRWAVLRLLLRQFWSPLVLILVFAAALSIALQDWIEAAIILSIVFGSAGLGFTQEYRASAAVAALRRRLALTVRVRRDGAIETITATALVPGDVIVLAAGNLVPADGVVLAATDFLVSEASLTGESFPVEKRPGALPTDTPMARRTNCVFLGTSVRSGTAEALVVHTGSHTAFGAIAERLRARAPETEFARGVRQFGYLLGRVMIVMVLFVVTVNQLLGRPVVESLLFAVALAVGLSPELLPAIVSVTLSHGARVMARRGVIVRRLEAIENLGSMDVLCTDKTGTLTVGDVALSACLDPDGEASTEVHRLAYLNAVFETGIANPLDAAIVASADRPALQSDGYRKIDEIPYDFIRKRLTIVVAAPDDPDHHLVISKGAFANMLAVCSTVRRASGEIALDEPERARLQELFRRQGSAGFRLLAIAVKRVAARAQYGHDDETAMALAGFLLFLDPLKADVQRVIRQLAQLGVAIKIVTGDNRHVAAHIAEGVGLDGAAMLTGEEIGRLKDEALWQRAEDASLFVEVDPQQKERIVRALQRMGHAVGYLGDGINDAPALHAADVGISVQHAVDVARESADVVLLRRDLDVLRRGVEEGRRTFANTLKYITITTSANFGNMVSMALATPLLPFLPLAAKQILLNNFLSDIPSIAISTDNVDAERTAHAQRWRVGDVRRFMIVFGCISTAFDLITFTVLLKGFGADQAIFQTAWFVVSLLTELAVVLVLRTERPAFASLPSRLLLWSTAAVCAVALAVPYLRPVAAPFGFVPLGWPLLAAIVLIVIGYVMTTEVIKLWVSRPPATPSTLLSCGRAGSPADRAAARGAQACGREPR